MTFISSKNAVERVWYLSPLLEVEAQKQAEADDYVWMDGEGGREEPRGGRGGRDRQRRVRHQLTDWPAKERGFVESGKTLTAQSGGLCVDLEVGTNGVFWRAGSKRDFRKTHGFWGSREGKRGEVNYLGRREGRAKIAMVVERGRDQLAEGAPACIYTKHVAPRWTAFCRQTGDNQPMGGNLSTARWIKSTSSELT